MSLSSVNHRMESTENVLMRDLNDLRHLNAEEQSRFLLEREAALRSANHAERKVYLLRGSNREVLHSVLNATHNMFDYDGTLTGIGSRYLYEDNIQEIKGLQNIGMRNNAVTGRHRYQVEDLWSQHPDGTGIVEDYIEQGFYRLKQGQEPEIFAGDPAIEQNVHIVRKHLADHLAEIEQLHQVRFVTTSAEGYPHAHQTMYSIDAHNHNGSKIEDPRVHDAIIDLIRNIWRKYDMRNEIAKVGTSSTGTFELTPDGLSKEATLKRYMDKFGIEPEKIAYFGDSSNDLPVFASTHAYLKSVVVNSHTKPNLIENARFATVGTGNASPLLSWMNKVKRAATK